MSALLPAAIAPLRAVAAPLSALAVALALLAGCGAAADGSSTGDAAGGTPASQAPLLRDLKTLTEDDLRAIAGPVEAAALLEAFDRTVRTFPHGNWGPRDPSVPTPEAFADLTGGLCDSAVEGFRRMARTLGVQATVVNLNLNLYDPSYGLRGHTIAAVATSDGQLLFDPLYGIAFRTAREGLDDAILSSPLRQAYLSAHHTDERGPSLGHAAALYGHVDDERFSAAQNDKPFIHTRSPWIRVDGAVRIGAADGSGADLVERFGSHFDYIGSLYTPMQHEWRFEGLEAGRRYSVEFRLAGVWHGPFAAAIDVDDGNDAPALHRDVVLADGAGSLTASFVARGDRATLRVTPAAGYAAALVDAVTVEASSPAP